MKDPQAVMFAIFVCVAGTLPQAMARGVSDNPLQMVLDLLASLSTKVHEEGERAAAEYKEYFEWCDDASHSTSNMVSTATTRKGKLEAKISALGSSIEASTTKIEDLASSIALSTSELSKATDMRQKEAADFAASEKELVRIGSQLDRAVAAIEREAEKSPAALTQLGNANIRELLQSLSVVVDAAGLSGSDRPSLLALAQAASSADEDAGMHEAQSLKEPHSQGILDALEDLKVKAEAQLAGLRNSETEARHNFELLRQSLESQLATDNKDLEEEKAAKAEAEEGKASSQGDLELALNKQHGAEESLQTLRTACMQTAADHEASIKARDEELKALAKAIDLLKSTTSGAASQSYTLLQLGSRSGDRAIALLRRLAHEHHSVALAQLASRAAAMLQYGVKHGEDPFAKVKGLIQGLIESLQREADTEATEKAFCDEELAKTESKKGDLEDDTEKLTVKIDQAAAKSADLKEEVRELQLELAELTSMQAHMDKMRQETHAEHVVKKADLEMGVNGVRKALGVLREYYSADEAGAASLIEEGPALASLMQQPAIPTLHSKSMGAGSSIIGILEVVEQDFATGLAKEETEEEDAQTEYEQLTQENKVAKTVKGKDVEHKSQQIKQLSQSLAELTADRDSVNTEATAVAEYYEKLKERCIAKPEGYEKRKERREAEIEGLKEALDILENEASFVQRKRRGHIRGSLAPH